MPFFRSETFSLGSSRDAPLHSHSALTLSKARKSLSERDPLKCNS